MGDYKQLKDIMWKLNYSAENVVIDIEMNYMNIILEDLDELWHLAETLKTEVQRLTKERMEMGV